MFTNRVVPSSGKAQFVRDKTGTLKYFLKSPPEKGEANAELIKLLAGALKVPQTKIQIIRGATSRTKTIKILIDIAKE